jgi:hypothetical protein
MQAEWWKIPVTSDKKRCKENYLSLKIGTAEERNPFLVMTCGMLNPYLLTKDFNASETTVLYDAYI